MGAETCGERQPYRTAEVLETDGPHYLTEEA